MDGTRLYVGVLSLLFAMLCGEVFLRAIRFADARLFFIRDPATGYHLRPGVEGWSLKEGTAFFTVNSDGMPDAEHAVAKPAGTFRIAIVGDSFTEAAGILREQRFSAVVGHLLAQCPALAGERPEVLCFGVSGFGTAHELLEMRSRVWKYSPDVVLLQLFPGNDLRNNVRELNGGEEPTPYFVSVNGALEYRPSAALPGERVSGWKQRLETGLYNRFRLLHLLHAARATWMTRSPAAVATSNGIPDDTYGFESGADWQIFLPPQTPAWEQAWQVTEGLLRMMKEETAAHGAAFRVAVFPSGIQVHPDRTRRETFRVRIGAASLSYPGERLAEIAARNGILLLDLTPPMLEYAEQHQATLYGYPTAMPGLGHWNERGHRFGGERMGRWLCETLTKPGDTTATKAEPMIDRGRIGFRRSKAGGRVSSPYGT